MKMLFLKTKGGAMKNVFGWVFFAVVLLIVGGIIYSTFNLVINCYNGIITSEQNVEKSIGDLNSEYERRYALVDNLVSVVKEYKGFETYLAELEKDIYIKTAEAKAAATKLDVKYPEQMEKKIKKENELGNLLVNAMDKLMVLAQKYPEIKDPQLKDRTAYFDSLDKLRRELKEIEGEILYARKSVNEYIRSYNQNIKIFPANLIAIRFGFEKVDYYDNLDEKAKENVKISF